MTADMNDAIFVTLPLWYVYGHFGLHSSSVAYLKRIITGDNMQEMLITVKKSNINITKTFHMATYNLKLLMSARRTSKS